MKRILLLIVVLTFSLSSFSQTNQNNATSNTAGEANMFTIRHNAFIVEDLLFYSYERLIPLSENAAFGIKAGIMVWDPFMPQGEFSFVGGGPKSFFEIGFGGIIDISDEGGFFTMRAGYRYQAPKGFLFKASAIFSPDNFILPLIGIGYAF